MKIRSIRKSLTIWYLLIVAILLTIFSVALYTNFRKNLTEMIDAALLSTANTILQLNAPKLTGADLIRNAIRKTLGVEGITVYTQAVNLSGKVNYKAAEIDFEKLPLSALAKKNGEKGLSTYESYADFDQFPIRVLTVPVMYNKFFTNQFIRVATGLKHVELALRKVLFFILLAIPLALVIVSLGGAFLADRALLPVRQLVRKAKHIRVNNLSERLTVENDDAEIQELAEAFNTVFNNLHNSFNNISQFSSDVSHELKTPLTVIRGQTELTLRKRRDMEEYQNTLISNLEEVENMTQIIDHLSLISKLERKESLFVFENIDLFPLINKVIDSLKPLADKKQIKIFASDLLGLKLQADTALMRMVFTNLITNAIKYTDYQDSIIIETYVRGVERGIKVIDHGPGIQPEDIELLFERFYRADKSRNKDTGGSGLGLHIVRTIIESHGGKVFVKSKPNVETCFQIVLWDTCKLDPG